MSANRSAVTLKLITWLDSAGPLDGISPTWAEMYSAGLVSEQDLVSAWRAIWQASTGEGHKQ